MIVLTNTDFQELQVQAQQQGETIYQPTLGTQIALPQMLGTGGQHDINLRNGLTIQIRNGTLVQPINLVQQHDYSFPLVAKFYLSGFSRVQTPNVKDVAADYEEINSFNYLYYLPNLTEVEQWPANKALYVVMLVVKPEYFSSLGQGDMTLPKPLQKLLEGNLTERFHQSLGKTPPAMKQVIQQILHCPYQGVMQQLYLESKALELFTLQFAHWANRDRSSPQLAFSSNDVERLHHAREILLEHFDNPPSLLEIAQQVGLNDHKLKQGFRHLYGTTLFGYLHDYRMQQARHLLLNSNLSVAGVAARVGYRNPEAFSTAFRRKFAVSPKAYQLGNCY
ncbi:AraC family transcriptional regulator [Gloeocapsopsis sp. IPPAS B-1203]|uniref:helix-turn-helix transcriptional regulator n=1 Tax=Gloeocapsopsis sp. IPPAS B-1203 TaxID=2049454 RepID=UPI000C181C1E|nr:AraC family transcriptional regulator [Gloeocapsopsis sp. IPPAS B-1203]PIG95190.1 AraC family transcriptional regulator [Gloeocapsopsis sp. IPPAS B-1203]